MMMPMWITFLFILGAIVAIAVVGRAVGGWPRVILALLVGYGILAALFYLRHHAVPQPPAMVHNAMPQPQPPPVRAIQQPTAEMEHAANRIVAPRVGSIPDRAIIEPAPRAPEPDDERAAIEVASVGVATAEVQPISPAPTPPISTTPASNPMASDLMALPDWVSTDEGWQPDGNYYVVVFATGRSTDECWNQLFAHVIPMTVYQYAHREIGGGWPYPLVDSDLVKLLIADQHVAPFSAGSVRMDGSFDFHKLYVRLHFKPEVRHRMLAGRAEVLKSSRVAYTVWIGVLACGAIGVVFGYLKLDDWTSRIHTRRLRFAAGGLLVCVAFCTCLLLVYVAEVESYGGLFSAF